MDVAHERDKHISHQYGRSDYSTSTPVQYQLQFIHIQYPDMNIVFTPRTH